MAGTFIRQTQDLISLSVQEISDVTHGELLAGDAAALITRISTDTRADLRGSLFVALKGENFDGGDFAEEALAAGAAGVLADRNAAERIASLHLLNGAQAPIVVAVDDAGEALKRLGSLVAEKSLAKIVAVTGSTGKTTTKDMLHGLLRPQTEVVASPASFNNEVGVPLTLLQLRRETRVAVLEMGMQRPGEIADLCGIANPEIAVITNIGPAHLEYAGSLEAIARGKAEIAAALPPHGGLVIPYGEDLLLPYTQDMIAEVITFGFEEAADIHPISCHVSADGRSSCVISVMGAKIEVELAFSARYHLLNFMAALGAYTLLGLSMDSVSETAANIQLSTMRGERLEIGGVTLLNDCYNANPLSMSSALEYLVSIEPGRRTVAILGDMGELGPESADYHRQVGSSVSDLGIDRLIAVGDLAEGYVEGAQARTGSDNGHRHFNEPRQAAKELAQLILPGDVVLVKGSRFMKLELLVAEIVANNSDIDDSVQPCLTGEDDTGAMAEG
jgi:UDP-N-acetylmuramoyl-tripeptide--D-alanyl-D-alanine ligase